MAAVQADPLTEHQVGNHDGRDHDPRHEGGVQLEDQDRGQSEGDQDEVDEPGPAAAAAHSFGVAVRAGHRGDSLTGL